MDDFFTRHEGESDQECIYRICAMKDELGYTWPEMAEILNDALQKSYSDSKYRKDYTAFCKYSNFDAAPSVSLSDEALAVAKERQKLYATKVETTRVLRQKSRQELFYENIAYAIKTLPVPEYTGIDQNKSTRNYEYVLTIADLQAGAKFSLDCNSYSLYECAKRFWMLYGYVADYVVENNIKKLHVVELGDTIQGILRVSDLQLNETSVVEATVAISRLIADFLNNLSSVCCVEYYHVPCSNHSQTRPLSTKASELASEDIEFVIGNYIQDILRNNNRVNVHLNFGYDHIDIPVFNYNIIALHGHTIKNLDTALKDLSVKHRKLIDYIFLGHFHTGKIIPGNAHEGYDTELIISPSFQGADPFAYNKLGLSSKAACKIYKFDDVHGCIGTEKFILN